MLDPSPNITTRVRALLAGATPASQREARVLFTYLKAKLVLWVYAQGWEIAEGEGLVALTDARDGDHDGPHKAGGAHYLGTGEDLVLYLDLDGDAQVDDYVSRGGHPVWKAIGEKWESMHPSCRWGGRFGDDNHVSIHWAGRS